RFRSAFHKFNRSYVTVMYGSSGRMIRPRSRKVERRPFPSAHGAPPTPGRSTRKPACPHRLGKGQQFGPEDDRGRGRRRHAKHRLARPTRNIYNKFTFTNIFSGSILVVRFSIRRDVKSSKFSVLNPNI